MRKLTGLLAFAVALAAAVVVTKYYSTPTRPKEPQQPAATQPMPPDPIAEMRVTTNGFRELARRSAALGPRVAAVLEGGYNVVTLPRLVNAALEGFSAE